MYNRILLYLQKMRFEIYENKQVAGNCSYALKQG